jgi:hypothetical protein
MSENSCGVEEVEEIKNVQNNEYEKRFYYLSTFSIH